MRRVRNSEQPVQQGRCMSCREIRDIIAVRRLTLRDSREIRIGSCGVCGTRVFRIDAPLGGMRTSEYGVEYEL